MKRPDSAKRPALTRDEALGGVPVKFEAVREIPMENGQSMLSCPMAVRPLIAAWIQRLSGAPPKPRIRKIQLDLLGTQVWGLIDGRRNVKEIVEIFARIHQLHLREAEVSVTLFLRSLGKKGLIGIR